MNVGAERPLHLCHPLQAACLHEKTLEARTRVLGPDHVRTRSSRRQLEAALRLM